jgi:hypothetical protein
MYKPRFCSECGERIERERWRIWHSLRFCDVCAKKFRFARAGVIGLILGVGLALGFLIGVLSEGRKHGPSPALHIERLPIPIESASAQAAEAPSAEKPQAQICGAPTKSGKPCQRRVKDGGRCYQHRGVSERK